MTVAIGAACAEGTVLLTDSPGPLYDPERHAWCVEPDPGDPKLVVLPKTGVAFIHSGSRPETYPMQKHWSRFDTSRVSDLRYVAACVLSPLLQMEPPTKYIEEIARAASRRDGMPPDLEAARAMVREHELLIANMGYGGDRLGLMTNRSAPGAPATAGTARESWLDHGYIVAGAPTDWWAEQPKPDLPDSLSDAQALVLGIVERFHRAKYREASWHFLNWKWRRLGESVEMPACLPPYIGVTWDARSGTVHRWRVELGKDDVFLEPTVE